MQEILQKQIRKIIEQRKLTLVMNNVKWQELINAVSSLPFPPPFIRKDLFSQNPKLSDFAKNVYHVGNWQEGIYPLLTVEWIKVRPRFLKTNRRQTTPKLIDISKAFEQLLLDYAIPFSYYDSAYVIYNYIGSDNSIVAQPL